MRNKGRVNVLDMNDINNIQIPIKENRYVFDGKSVPRATEIISKMIHEDYLLSWSNSLGFKHKNYKAVVKIAADYGTRVHFGIECFLKGRELNDDIPEIPFKAFLLWWEQINKNNTVIILGQEEKIICEWYGGTYDLLLSINGRIFLIDFKTSNYISYKYCLQLAAYRKILREKGINIDGTVILQLSKIKPIYNEFVLDTNIIEHKKYLDFCEQTFLSLVYGYYHILYAENQFKSNIYVQER